MPHKYLDSLKYAYNFSVESFFGKLSDGKVPASDENHCPSCNGPLSRSTVKETEVDWCQQCQGVWFDRGELTKLVTFERHMTPTQQAVCDGAQIIEGVGHLLALIADA